MARHAAASRTAASTSYGARHTATIMLPQQRLCRRGALLPPRSNNGAPVLAEAEDLKVRFDALQEEVASYRALNSENARLEDVVGRLVQENKDLAERLAAAQAEFSSKLAVSQKQAAATVSAAKMEISSKADEAERNLEDLRQQLRTAMTEREQVLFVMANAAGRLGELLYPTGSLPAGISINTTLQGPQGPVKPAAPKPASGGFMVGLVAAVKTLIYYAAGALGMYYAAAFIRSVPPTLSLEFGLGCLLVCWALPMLHQTLLPRAA